MPNRQKESMDTSSPTPTHLSAAPRHHHIIIMLIIGLTALSTAVSGEPGASRETNHTIRAIRDGLQQEIAPKSGGLRWSDLRVLGQTAPQSDRRRCRSQPDAHLEGSGPDPGHARDLDRLAHSSGETATSP